jgi:hypothetical protein
MPLHYEVETELTVPAEAFDANAIAVIDFNGGRYGGDWVISASTRCVDESLGEIHTSYDRSRYDLTKDVRYPNLAADTAYVWLHDFVKKLGWRLLSWDNFNSQMGPDERPYFVSVRAVIGSDKFVPAPGVKYADELPR